MKTSISHLIVIPKNKDRWKYYVNSNLKDSVYTKRDDLQYFIGSICSTKITNNAIYFLDHYKAFYINFQKDDIVEIRPNEEKAMNRIKNFIDDEIKNPDKILKKIKKDNKDNDTSYKEENENLLKIVLK